MTRTKNLFNSSSWKPIKSSQDNTFVNSRLKLSYQRLLRIEDYEKLVDFDSYEEIYRTLKESYHYELDESVSFKENINSAQLGYIHSIVYSMGQKSYGISKNSLIVDFFLIPLDFFNLKVLAKGLLEKKDFQELPFSITGNLSLEHLEGFFQGKVYSFLNPYLKEIWRLYNRQAEKIKDSYHLDLFWDQQLHLFYSSVFKKMQSEILTTLYTTRVDMINILTALRLKLADKEEDDLADAFVPTGTLKKNKIFQIFSSDMDAISELLSNLAYSKQIQVGLEAYKNSQNLSSLEKYFKEYLLLLYHRLVPRCANEDLVIIFSWLKQIEFANLSMVISGKESHISHSWILSKLRVVI